MNICQFSHISGYLRFWELGGSSPQIFKIYFLLIHNSETTIVKTLYYQKEIKEILININPVTIANTDNKWYKIQ